METLLQLIYVSTVSKSFQPADLDLILSAARERNPRELVSGMLLFSDNDFIQVLEGPEPAVRKIFSDISKDPRHTGVTIVISHRVSERSFEDWAMGFERLSGPSPVTEMFKIDRAAIETRMTDANRSTVLSFLKSFYRVTTRRHL